ncbi:glycosyltransferase [Bifidobacterium longum]|jgi:galactofuranosylgalactofuranosylrhamnosyl-N-acetylglucosaminyl-diphospho-decaprenol beta-1,5/1,6-galactofuranosyltransferase|nr:glycosyltransferase [Bifidobacterium longum]RHG87968.1 glycosyltransferase [Bifidobacterium longum]RHG89213.1 glycosyltransferase [Bifidobacterium longum]RHG91826.1 glycosyltransferase [Bifidobacterium longum]
MNENGDRGGSKNQEAFMKNAEPGNTWETVMRVVYPVKDAEQTLPLYAIDWTRPHVAETTLDSRIDMRRLEFGSMNQSTLQRMLRNAGFSDRVSCDSFEITGRASLALRDRGHMSGCTFFNAFPAAYWRRWTSVKTVRFEAAVRGNAKISVFRSTGRGLIYPVAMKTTTASESETRVCIDVPMTGLMDGGYFWFDAESLDGSVTITDATWSVPREARTAKHETTLSIAITTFNRASYCMDQLRTIAGASALRERLDTVYCTDQGSDLVKDQKDFDEVADNLGEQLTYIQQANLGGSGGFSRGMYETAKAGDSDFVLLLDDDAISEPESILRAIQFSDYTVRPVLVGGGMFHLDNRTMLYTQGERINAQRMWMYPSKSMGYNHDFSVEPLRDSPDRHQRIDEDFNGWWMCLIPIAVVKKIGLSMPVFIKFDDIEYGLRAKKAGFPTVCLPGVAVWHQAWHDKDPARSWEEYFTERNRWLAALLTYPDKAPRMLIETMYGDASLGLRFVYSAMALHHMALRDILRGPQYLVDCLPTKLGEVREVRARYPDAQAQDSFEAFPEPAGEVEPPKNHPSTMKSRYKAAVGLITKSFIKNANPDKAVRPDAAIPARDAAWTWLAFDHVNSALVTTPDGNGVAWLKRDNRRFRKSMLEGYRLTRRIEKNWKCLAAQYQSYGITSMETWAHIFGDK